VGAGIGAREIQIWTDVDGMLTADPRVVQAHASCRALVREAAELAYFGAKVLHPSTILPAVEHDIPVRILNSRRPDGTGTVITAAGAARRTPVTALACKRNLTVIDVTSTGCVWPTASCARCSRCSSASHRGDVVTTSEVVSCRSGGEPAPSARRDPPPPVPPPPPRDAQAGSRRSRSSPERHGSVLSAQVDRSAARAEPEIVGAA
jgi:hypothetical protein